MDSNKVLTIALLSRVCEFASANSLSFSEPLELQQLIGSLSKQEMLEFKAAKKKTASSKPKNCQKGYPCGMSCQPKNRNCQKPLQGQSKNYQDWLKMNSTQAQTASSVSAATQKSASTPKQDQQSILNSTHQKLKDAIASTSDLPDPIAATEVLGFTGSWLESLAPVEILEMQSSLSSQMQKTLRGGASAPAESVTQQTQQNILNSTYKKLKDAIAGSSDLPDAIAATEILGFTGSWLESLTPIEIAEFQGVLASQLKKNLGF